MRKANLAAVMAGGVLILSAHAPLEAKPGRTQAGGSYDLSFFTIDGGGGRSAKGRFDLTGSIGQPDAGVHTGGGYTLEGGFLGTIPDQTSDHILACLLGYTPPSLDMDLNGDGVVDAADLTKSILLGD